MDVKDKCPICREEYVWDACCDTFPAATELKTELEGNREVTLFLCPRDGGTIALMVVDEVFGGNVYVPSTQEL
jgi:hypothetical protein